MPGLSFHHPINGYTSYIRFTPFTDYLRLMPLRLPLAA